VAGARHGDRVVSDHGRAELREPLDEIVCGRVTQVVGVRLEGHPEHRDPFAFQEAQVLAEFLEHDVALAAVDVDGGLQDRHVVPVLLAGGDEGTGVLPEAAAAPPGTGSEEAVTDAAVEADAGDDLVDVRADAFAQSSDLVGVADLEGQEGVRGVLDHLGAGEGRLDHRRDRVLGRAGRMLRGREGLVDERGVQVTHALHGDTVPTEHDAVRVEAVADGGAFAQEFGVADHEVAVVVLGVGGVLDDAGDPVTGADRDGALVDDDLHLAVEVRGDVTRGALDVPEVRAAVRQGRRADADEDHVRVRDGAGVIARPGEAFGVLREHGVEARLVDGQVPAFELLDLACVHVQPGDLMAELGEHDGSSESDVTGADDCDV